MRPHEFFLEGGPDGVLLIHGLTGTPAEMRLVGRGLQRKGFTVYAMQLAGHCGSVDDLLATDRRDWQASVTDAVNELSRRVHRVFVAGLSMGAVLALDVAAREPDRIAGVGVYGATFRHDGWSIPPIAKLSFMLPALKRLGIGRGMSFDEQPPYGIKDERVRAQISSAMQSGDSSLAGLPGNPWFSLAEMHLLANEVRARLPDVVAPCLVAHSSHDDIASFRNAEWVMQGVRGPTELLVLDESYHMITVDREHRRVIDRTADFFGRVAAGALAQAA